MVGIAVERAFRAEDGADKKIEAAVRKRFEATGGMGTATVWAVEATTGAAGFEYSVIIGNLLLRKFLMNNCTWKVSQPRHKEELLMAIGRTVMLDHRLEKIPPIAKRGIPNTFRYLCRSLIDPTDHYFKRQNRYVVDHEDVNRSVEPEEKRCFGLSVQRALQSRYFFTVDTLEWGHRIQSVAIVLPYFWEETCNSSSKTDPRTIHLLGKPTCMGL